MLTNIKRMIRSIPLFILSLFTFSLNAQDCLLQVPTNPLSTGLFQPWYVSTSMNSISNCSQLIEGSEVFAEATILDISTGKIFIYSPLVIDAGTTPAVYPTNLTLPVNNIVTIHFGTNANSLTLISEFNMQEGLCVNGIINSIFGQFAYCNAINFFNIISNLINNGIVNIPSIKTSTLCDLCPTTRSFSIVDQDQSDNVITTYLVTTDLKIAQDNTFNRNNLKILKIISNGSDNKLLSVFVNPAIGCNSFSAPDFENNDINRDSLVLNELQASLNTNDIALIPSGDPMCLLNGEPNLEKLNAYRHGVFQPVVNQIDPDDNKKYCNSMLRIAIPFLVLHRNELKNSKAPGKDTTNLLNFLINRFINSWGILNCEVLTGNILHLKVIINNDGIVIDNNLDMFVTNDMNTYCTSHVYTIDMFYPTFLSIFLFILYSISLICINNTKYYYILKKTVYYININTLFFIFLFTLWWLSMLVYSFITDKLSVILFRLGVFIMINLSFIILPATRNNIFVEIFGASHKDIMTIHRIISILCIISIVIKFVIILIYYPPSFLIVVKNNMTGGSPLAGTIATISAILISIFTIPLIKKRSYETFYFTHRILGLILVVCSVWHYIISLYFIIPSLIIYFIDLYLRFLKTNKGTYLKLKKIGENEKNNYTILQIKISKNININPGCYFLVCIRNISSVEWHPFSMIEHDNKKLTFCAKNMGPNSWTDKLKVFVENENETKYNREVYIQGPYNYFDFNYIISRYNNIISISGGIGITPIFSIIDNIIELTYLEKIKKEIVLIWIVQDSTLIKNFIEKINIYKRSNINIEIYITQETSILNDALPIQYSKPDIENNVKKYFNMHNFKPKDTCILGSGPFNLLKNINSVGYKFNIDNFCENF